MALKEQAQLEKSSIFWKARVAIDEFFAGEPMTASRVGVWKTDGRNPDDSFRFVMYDTRVVIEPVAGWDSGM
jgi:hypothetical protein